MAARHRITARKQPRQERSRQTVDAILTAAARVLVKDGYERATTNRIAEVAGVSIGSLYEFFPSKDALFAALRQRHYDALNGVLSDMAALRALPLRDAARAMITLMIHTHATDPKLHVALEEQAPASNIECNRELERRVLAFTVAYLQEHRAKVRPSDLELAAFVVAQTAEALIHAAVVHAPERLADDRLAEEVTEMIVRYLAVDSVERAAASHLEDRTQADFDASSGQAGGVAERSPALKRRPSRSRFMNRTG